MSFTDWRDHLKADPLPWLLDEEEPAVRHRALRELLGFPSGYVADILQVIETVCEAGAGGDPRLANAIDWLLAQQDGEGRWPNRYRYDGKMHIDIDQGRGPSRWVTLRSCRVLKVVAQATAGA
jgi:hypothetical protein